MRAERPCPRYRHATFWRIVDAHLNKCPVDSSKRKHFGSTRIRPPKQTVYTCPADSPGRLERLTPDRGIARGLALADDERALLSSEPVVSGGAALARRGTCHGADLSRPVVAERSCDDVRGAQVPFVLLRTNT